MPQIIFSNSPNFEVTHGGPKEPSGWRPVVQDGEDAPALSHSIQDKVPKDSSIVLKPLRKKVATPKAGSEIGIGRRDRRVQDFGGDPKTYVHPYTSFQDPSVGEYKYAPGDPGSSGGAPMVVASPTKLVFSAEDTLYQDVTSPFPAPQGGSDLIQDTNEVPRNRPRITRITDKSKRLDRMKHWSGLPEPTPTQNVQNDHMTYPLARFRGHISVLAAEDDTPGWGFFGYPEFQRTTRENWGGKEVLVHKFKVTIYDKEGDSYPSLWLTFYIIERDGKLSLHKGSYLFDYADQKRGEAMFGFPSLPQDVAADIFGMLPDEVIQEAMDIVRSYEPDKGKKESRYEKSSKDGASKVKEAREEAREAQAEAERAKAEAERAKAEKAKALAEERRKQAEAIRRRVQEREKAVTEKIRKQRAHYYNVLTDPILDELAPGITPVERLFTTITKWDNGAFTADSNRLDSTARKLLAENPKGEGEYFRWDYSSPEMVEEEQVAKSKAGKMTVDRPAILRIYRKPSWEKIQDDVFKMRKDFLEGRE
jgi:hypothetical protein